MAGFDSTGDMSNLRCWPSAPNRRNNWACRCGNHPVTTRLNCVGCHLALPSANAVTVSKSLSSSAVKIDAHHHGGDGAATVILRGSYCDRLIRVRYIKENGRYFTLSGYLKLPHSTDSESGVGNIALLKLEIGHEHLIQSVQRILDYFVIEGYHEGCISITNDDPTDADLNCLAYNGELYGIIERNPKFC